MVVLSAMGKTTDGLISQAKEINPNPPKRELDMLMVNGEQISVGYGYGKSWSTCSFTQCFSG